MEILDPQREASGCRRIGFEGSMQLMFRRGGFSVLVKRVVAGAVGKLHDWVCNSRMQASRRKRMKANRTRDNFPRAVKLHVALQVLCLCTKPDCRRPTYGPTVRGKKLTNVGTAAHIIAAASKGPRAKNVTSYALHDRRRAKAPLP